MIKFIICGRNNIFHLQCPHCKYTRAHKMVNISNPFTSSMRSRNDECYQCGELYRHVWNKAIEAERETEVNQSRPTLDELNFINLDEAVNYSAADVHATQEAIGRAREVVTALNTDANLASSWLNSNEEVASEPPARLRRMANGNEAIDSSTGLRTARLTTRSGRNRYVTVNYAEQERRIIDDMAARAEPIISLHSSTNRHILVSNPRTTNNDNWLHSRFIREGTGVGSHVQFVRGSWEDIPSPTEETEENV